ncbi:hypothetical protein LXA43DRAFT_905543 [Ganoderma leucocontextum]|nr:hypothetical protein LXA43DRAFT_905543 [Ganoderma leucocontextum]
MAARAALILQGASVDLYPRVQSLVSSALTDARTFLAEVPRDHPSTGNVLNWVILLTMLLQKPEHAQEVESARQQLGQCVELMAHFGYKSLDMDLQRTQEFLFEEHDRGLHDWDCFVQGLDKLKSRVVHLSPERDEFLWLDQRPDSSDPLQASSNQLESSEKLSQDQLYRCSWCRSPSARPRRCTGCRAAIYCDSVCQKAHWPMHRATCRREKN